MDSLAYLLVHWAGHASGEPPLLEGCLNPGICVLHERMCTAFLGVLFVVSQRSVAVVGEGAIGRGTWQARSICG